MKIEELIQLVNPMDISKYRPEGELSGVTQDSREAGSDIVFVAVKGTQVDGYMFLNDAIEKGARVVITEEAFYTDKDVCVMEVENSRAVLSVLAQAFKGYPARSLKIIGITGTNGKTTTATLVYKTLMHCGKKVSMLGTVAKMINDEVMQSTLTTSDPVELADDMRRMVDAGSEYLVMEVSSHALHQLRVSSIPFTIAAFTNISHDHLDYHLSLEEYAKAKKILFDGLGDKATAIVNADDSYANFMVQDCKAAINDFGFRTDALFGCSIQSNSPEGLRIKVEGVRLSSSLMGRFNAYNLSLAYLICRALKLRDEEIAEAFSVIEGAPGRMESIGYEGSCHVLVDYAHTPDALENLLKTVQEFKKNGQKIVTLFGCGGDRDTTKRPAMARIAETYSDVVIVSSDNPRTEDPESIIQDIMKGFKTPQNVKAITDRKEAIELAIRNSTSQDILVIAGKGHETYQEVNGVRHHFDDREIALEALQSKYPKPKGEADAV